MKIAWIDRHYGEGEKFHKREINEYILKNGFESEVDIEETLEKFREKFGSLDRYKVLILHGGISNQEEYLNKIPKAHPNLEIYLLSCDPKSYTEEETRNLKTIVISYANEEAIEDSDLGELIRKLTKE